MSRACGTAQISLRSSAKAEQKAEEESLFAVEAIERGGRAGRSQNQPVGGSHRNKRRKLQRVDGGVVAPMGQGIGEQRPLAEQVRGARSGMDVVVEEEIEVDSDVEVEAASMGDAREGGEEDAVQEKEEQSVIETIGVVRHTQMVVQLADSLAALGQHHTAFRLLIRLLDDSKHETRRRALDDAKHPRAHDDSRHEPLLDVRQEVGGASAAANAATAEKADELFLLRTACGRAAYACREWGAAYQQARTLCMQRPSSWVGWTILYAASAKARQRAHDERWMLRALLRSPSADQIALGVAHNCLLSRSFKVATAEYMQLQACCC
jgi:hypothetical protein